MKILSDIKVIKNLSFQETTRVCIDKNENISQERIRQVREDKELSRKIGLREPHSK